MERRTKFIGHLINKGDTCSIYWKWKTLVIDFKDYQDMKYKSSSFCWPKEMDWRKKYDGDGYKLSQGLHYVGTPDEEEHSWYNGGWSSEYNDALNCLLELGLIEITDDELEEAQ